MQKARLLTRIVLVAAFAALTVTGCMQTGDPKTCILGKWHADNGLSVQFYKTGRMVLRYPAQSAFSGKEDVGRWRIMPDNTIKVTPEGTDDSRVCSVSFLDGDRMLVRGSNGSSLVFTHLSQD